MKVNKLSLFTLAISIPTSACFAPNKLSSSRSFIQALQSTATPPERIAPDAGYIPEWEDRPGLSPDEFMESDMSKPDASGMWECPLTRWDSDE